VRRTLAVVGHEGPFEQGRQQMQVLAGLSIATKAVELTAEAIGAYIEVREQRQLGAGPAVAIACPQWPAHLRNVRGDAHFSLRYLHPSRKDISTRVGSLFPCVPCVGIGFAADTCAYTLDLLSLREFRQGLVNGFLWFPWPESKIHAPQFPAHVLGCELRWETTS
jgi:hypothetical protein